MHLIVRPEAEGDLADAYAWYEQQRAGLGDEFLTTVDATFDFILERPLSFPVVHKTIRRALMMRFPYGVYFIGAENTISILAVLHGHRDPGELQGRAERII